MYARSYQHRTIMSYRNDCSKSRFLYGQYILTKPGVYYIKYAGNLWIKTNQDRTFMLYSYIGIIGRKRVLVWQNILFSKVFSTLSGFMSFALRSYLQSRKPKVYKGIKSSVCRRNLILHVNNCFVSLGFDAVRDCRGNSNLNEQQIKERVYGA